MHLDRRGAAASGLMFLVVVIAAPYAWYRVDLAASEQRIASGSAIAKTAAGLIEYAETGTGEPVLVIHGSGGGFDQGLLVAGLALPHGVRVIAPSRFGYLRTPLPADATAENQAAAHAALLDSLAVEQAVVVGISAGAPSAVAFARVFPERTAALILISPAVFSADRPEIEPTLGNRLLLGIVMQGSDFTFWVLKRFAYSTVVHFMGVEPGLYKAASADNRARMDGIIDAVMPLWRRLPGMINDGEVIGASGPYPLSELAVPALLLCARDDLLADCNEAERAARTVPGIHRAILQTGGHLLLGRWQETRDAIERFLYEAGRPHAGEAAVQDNK